MSTSREFTESQDSIVSPPNTPSTLSTVSSSPNTLPPHQVSGLTQIKQSVLQHLLYQVQVKQCACADQTGLKINMR